MYHIIGIGVTAVILYFLSYIFYRNGFYNRLIHRKIWNVLLAAAFLTAASAGLFLALQISYKWNVPFMKAILKWHVEFGIALAFTGLFHFVWHLSYFIRKEKNSESSLSDDFCEARTANQNGLNLFIVGFVSTSVQLLLMREIMNISGGYELVTGTFLASWLIGSAAGSYASRYSSVFDLKKLNIVFGLNIILSLVLMLLLGRLYFNPGETPSFFVSILYTLIVLLPFTFVSGFLFMKITSVSGEQYNIKSGNSFSLETAGGVVSGIAITFLSYKVLDTYQLILLIVLLYFSYLLLSFIYKARRARIIIAINSFLFILLLIITKPDRILREVLLPGIRVITTTDTPYGNVTRGEYGGEESLYYNHRLVQWHNNETDREETVHYAMLQHDRPLNVLVISGDINSILQEIMKYKIEKVWYVERDPELLKINASGNNGSAGILNVINTDAYRFVHETNAKFDIILLVVPPPSTLVLNRYYTTDFFESMRMKLNKKGVIMCSPGVGETYFNRESTVLYSSVFNSLKSVFRNVTPIVGNKLYYLASDDSLSTRICYLSEKRGIKNIYVSTDFLSDDLIERKTDEFLESIDSKVATNTLEMPTACFHFQSYSLSKTDPGLIPSIFLIIIIFIFPVFSVRRRNFLMYSAAGALSGFEIIALLTIQSSAGNMYHITGLIIAGLMTGLALGSGFDLTTRKKHSDLLNSAILILFYSGMVLVLNKLLTIEIRTAGIIFIILLTTIPSFFTGQIYRSVTETTGLSSSPSVYSADLAGSAMAFIAVSAIAVPLLGISHSLFLLSGLIFAGFLFGTTSNK